VEDILERIVRYGGSLEEILDQQEKLREAERTLGPDSVDLVHYLGRLADLYEQRGLIVDATPLWRRSLVQWEKLNAKDTYPGSLRTLAQLCIRLGDLERAERYYRQLVSLSEKQTNSGRDADPSALTIALEELASHLTIEKKFTEAEQLYKRVIEIEMKARAYGPEDQLTLASMSKLADFYFAQGNYAQAEEMHRTIQEIAQRKYPRPSERLWVVPGFGITDIYMKQGRYAEVEEIYRNSLRGSSFIPYAKLAIVLVLQGKQEEAEEFRKTALERWADQVELGQSLVVNTLSDLALAYRSQGNNARAEEIYRFVMAAWDEKGLWPATYGRLRIREQLTMLLRGQGREADAAAVERQDAQTYWRKWMVVCDRNYAAGRYDDASRYVLEAIREAVRGFGDHVHVAEGLDRYAEILRKRNRPAPAAEAEARAKLIRSKLLTH
jgi:tetratricopeptide (TPR) repeat protein